MVCLGPRKKEKKATFQGADGTRGINDKTTRSKLKPVRETKASSATDPSSTDTSPASSIAKRVSAVPRPSLEAKAVKRPTSRNSLAPSKDTTVRNSLAPPKDTAIPRTTSRPTSPQRKSQLGTARTSLIQSVKSVGQAKTTHARTSSAASTASAAKRSPISQMREEYDELKVQNDVHLQMIAQQKAELEALKQKLASAPASPEPNTSSPPAELATEHQIDQLKIEEKDHPPHPPTVDGDNTPSPHQDTLDIPSLLVTDTVELADMERLLAEKEEAFEKQRRENERLLAEKELVLEEERKAWEEEKKSLTAAHTVPLEDAVSQQLQELQRKNDEAVQTLAAKESELESLRQSNTDPATAEKVNELNHQLQVQKAMHEKSLKVHEEILAEKELLLASQKEALESLHSTHQQDIRSLKSSQTSNILAMKQKHKKDTLDLQQRLTEAEKAAHVDPALQLEEEVEKILREFEQTEHNHTVEIQSMEQSHASELMDMKVNHEAKVKSFQHWQSKNSGSWTSRFLPTEAVSWPKPHSLASLRKTTTTPRSKFVPPSHGPILIPSNPKKIHVYYSSISGNASIKKNQEDMQQLLKGKGIEYELIDVAASEVALKYMKKANNNGSEEGRAKEVPQLFVGGEYRGQYQDVLTAVEEDTLDSLLIPSDRVLSVEERVAIETAEAHATQPLRMLAVPSVSPILRKTVSTKLTKAARDPELPVPTVRKTVSTKLVKPLRDSDEDEELFRLLEQELGKEKMKDTNLDLLFQ